MTETANTKIHPDDIELADLLEGMPGAVKRKELEEHIASCDECLARIVSARESVEIFNAKLKTKMRKGKTMKNINIYLILAIISFILSFVFPRYFIQSLVATLLLGTKWIVDSKTTKMLVTIYEAWKAGGSEEASRIMEKIDSSARKRF